MREELKRTCDNFIASKHAVNKSFVFGTSPVAGAFLFAGDGKVADEAELKKLNKLLKEKEGIFSAFRSHMQIPVVCMMALADDPSEFVDNLKSTFKKLNAYRTFDNEYDIISAMILNKKASGDDVDKYVKKSLDIYEKMKGNHFFQTGGEDMPFAAIIAATDKDSDEVLQDAEKCYKLLRERFPLSGAVQPLAHILAIGNGTPEEKVDKAVKLYDAYKKAGLKYGKSYELATLGSLASLDMSVDEIVAETREAYDYLNNNHGYGFLEASKEEKIMTASLMVLLSHKAANSDEMESAALSAELAIALSIELVVIMVTTSMIVNSANNVN